MSNEGILHLDYMNMDVIRIVIYEAVEAIPELYHLSIDVSS